MLSALGALRTGKERLFGGETIYQLIVCFGFLNVSDAGHPWRWVAVCFANRHGERTSHAERLSVSRKHSRTDSCLWLVTPGNAPHGDSRDCAWAVMKWVELGDGSPSEGHYGRVQSIYLAEISVLFSVVYSKFLSQGMKTAKDCLDEACG